MKACAVVAVTVALLVPVVHPEQAAHYGKLVTAYRVNGIVPPVSRPK